MLVDGAMENVSQYEKETSLNNAKMETNLMQKSQVDQDKNMKAKADKIKAENAKKGTKRSGKPAIFITGATHARELISTSLVFFELLQLL